MGSLKFLKEQLRVSEPQIVDSESYKETNIQTLILDVYDEGSVFAIYHRFAMQISIWRFTQTIQLMFKVYFFDSFVN